MAFVYELPYKIVDRHKDVAHLILGDWQVNGIYSAVSGTPFTITANGADAQHAGQRHADGEPERRIQGHRRHGRRPGSTSTRRRSASRRESSSATRAATSSAARATGTWTCSIFRAFPIGGGGKRLEFRAEFFNLTNTPKWGSPVTRHHQQQLRAVTTVGNDGARQRQRERLGHRRAADPLRAAVPVLSRLQAADCRHERRRGLRSRRRFLVTRLVYPRSMRCAAGVTRSCCSCSLQRCPRRWQRSGAGDVTASPLRRGVFARRLRVAAPSSRRSPHRRPR